MKKIKCPVCQQEFETFTGEYHYVESGLDNVWLRGIEIMRCACGDSPLLNSPLALHDEIARCLLNQPVSLSGQGIKFLRKRLALTGREFSGLLGVDNATVSRWEHSKDNPSNQADRLIRLLYAVLLGLTAEAEKLAKMVLSQITAAPTKPPIHVMADKLGNFSCTLA